MKPNKFITEPVTIECVMAERPKREPVTIQIVDINPPKPKARGFNMMNRDSHIREALFGLAPCDICNKAAMCKREKMACKMFALYTHDGKFSQYVECDDGDPEVIRLTGRKKPDDLLPSKAQYKRLFSDKAHPWWGVTRDEMKPYLSEMQIKVFLAFGANQTAKIETVSKKLGISPKGVERTLKQALAIMEAVGNPPETEFKYQSSWPKEVTR